MSAAEQSAPAWELRNLDRVSSSPWQPLYSAQLVPAPAVGGGPCLDIVGSRETIELLCLALGVAPPAWPERKCSGGGVDRVSRALEALRPMVEATTRAGLAEKLLGAHAPHLAESAREHLRQTCRAVGADPDAAEVRARQAWEAKLALARESVLPASGSLAETYDEERLRVCRGGSAS